MPSGAKKRKAAKRKKEHGVHHHPPDSPSGPPPPPQGNGHGDDGDSGDPGSPSSRDEHPLTEEEAEEKTADPSPFESMESPESKEPLAPTQKLEETVEAVSEPKDDGVTVEFEETPPPPPPPLPPSTVPEDVSVEFVRSEDEGESDEEKGLTDEALGETGYSIGRIVTVTEEVDQASESIVENHDDSAGMGAPSGQREVIVPPLPDRNAEPCPDTAREEIVQKSEVAPVPLVERRASLCNCCGLFDVFMGSQR